MVQHADIDHSGITGVGGGNPLSLTQVYRATDQTVTGSGTLTAISWSNEVVDNAGCWAIGTPTKFVIPAGLNGRKAEITCSAYFYDSTNGNYRAIYLYRGGTGGENLGAVRVPDLSVATGVRIQVVSRVITLATSDEIEAYMLADSAGAFVVGGADLVWMQLKTVD